MIFTRRDWLRSVVSAAGTAALAPRGHAAAPLAQGIRLGFSLYGMKGVATAAALKTCADIGYSGVELPLMPDWPCDPAKLPRVERAALRQQLTDLSLDLPALMENLPLVVPAAQHQTHLERLRAAAGLAHELVPDAPPLIETVLGGKPDQWAELKQSMVDALGDWERVAAAGKTVIAIKAHVSNALRTPEDALWLVRQIRSPWIKLAFDFSHFQRQQLDLKTCWQTMAAETVFIHVKDNLTVDGKTEFALPGEGETDYVDYVQLLKTGGYRGSVMVEVSAQVSSKPGYNPVLAAERCYLNLRPAFERAGLRARI
jgi:sugar phosphate isomerase/epimerase